MPTCVYIYIYIYIYTCRYIVYTLYQYIYIYAYANINDVLILLENCHQLLIFNDKSIICIWYLHYYYIP